MSKKKKNKGLLPKKIAGRKVPKALRKGRMADFLASPIGIAILSDALVLAGGSLLGHESHRGSKTRRFLKHPMESLEAAADKASDGGSEIAGSAAEASRRLAAAFAAGVKAFYETLSAEEDEVPTSYTPEPRRKASPTVGEPKAAH